MSQQKNPLPKIQEDNSWTSTVHGVEYKFREATFREKGMAFGAAQNQQEGFANLLSIICQRKNEKGEWTKINSNEILESGERLGNSLQAEYTLGLAALEIEAKKPSTPSSQEKAKTDAQSNSTNP